MEARRLTGSEGWLGLLGREGRKRKEKEWKGRKRKGKEGKGMKRK